MSGVKRSVVTGVGSYLPEHIVTNDDLAKVVDTSDAWITERTGIRRRHKAAPDQPVSDLATAAARKALEAAGRQPGDVDLIVVATTTPDLTFPATATIVQRKLGCPIGPAFDVQAVCSGFVYALSVADGFVARGRARCALVIGAEEMTRLMDWTDRGTCVLFGDGAGAVVLEGGEGAGDTTDRGLLGFALMADGAKQDLLYVDGGVSTDGKIGHLRMQGNQVFRHAVVNISEAIMKAAADAGVQVSDVDWFIPHQANQRIIDAVGERLGIPAERSYVNIDRYGNTSAASIPIALDEAVREGKVKRGQVVLMAAFGAGLTWAASVVRW